MRGIMNLLMVHECTRIDKTLMIRDHGCDIVQFELIVIMYKWQSEVFLRKREGLIKFIELKNDVGVSAIQDS